MVALAIKGHYFGIAHTHSATYQSVSFELQYSCSGIIKFDPKAEDTDAQKYRNGICKDGTIKKHGLALHFRRWNIDYGILELKTEVPNARRFVWEILRRPTLP